MYILCQILYLRLQLSVYPLSFSKLFNPNLSPLDSVSDWAQSQRITVDVKTTSIDFLLCFMEKYEHNKELDPHFSLQL